MGCFFACFRFRESDRGRHSFLFTSPRTSKERLVSKNQLTSVFLCEERGSPCANSFGQDSFDSELKNEARFLKACGTLLQTPAEFRKASQKIIAENKKESESSSKPQSCRILQWDEPTDQTEASQVVCDESDFSVCKSESHMPNEMKVIRKSKNSLASLMSDPESADSESESMSTKSKSVNNYLGTVSAGIFDTSTPQIANQTQQRVLMPSPYPTPLKLTDEMQTPGTVYPTNFDKIGAVKNARIRSQYVYPVINPASNFSQLKTVKDDSQTTHSDDNKQTCNVVTEELDAGSSCNEGHKQQDTHDPSPVALSLSQWLKPPLSEEERRKNWEASPKEKSPSGKCSGEDRPIIGLVAAHWNDDKSSHISPKWWDGNGIPNSTNKYKEDQRVSWHATPFEERLEKALSDEKILPERKLQAISVKFGVEDE